MTIRDALGREHSFAHPPGRVVSLVPSITETLFDLGAGASVAGITDFCIFPPALALPRLGGTKNPRIDAIRALAPDLVHMNLEENLERHAREIETFAPLFVSEPKSVNDVVSLLATLGAIHACEPRAAEWITEIEAFEQQPRSRFTFACPIWKKPWMWCGGDTYVSNLVARAGGVNVLGDMLRYPTVALEDVLTLKPEVMFLPDEPYLFTEEDAAELGERVRVVGPFPGHLFTWHGTRTLEGLRYLFNAVNVPR
jgi:ABC-type Fe3+-hydroxamate transport system substrate-binding protein